MKIIYISELVGSPGIYCVKESLDYLVSNYNPDFLLANSNSATNGFGLGKKHCIYLKKMGIDLLINSDKAFFKKDMTDFFPITSFAIRPYNIQNNIGRGWSLVKKNGKTISVISLLGLSNFMKGYPANPYATIKKNLQHIKEKSQIVVVSFHSVATAEKQMMGHLCQELEISCMIGSGALVQSADYKILNNTTAYINDCGRTGSSLGVCGFQANIEVEKFLYKIPKKSLENWESLELNAILIEVDESTNHATKIDTIKIPVQLRNTNENRNNNWEI